MLIHGYLPPSEGTGVPEVRATRLKNKLDVKGRNFIVSVILYVVYVVGAQ